MTRTVNKELSVFIKIQSESLKFIGWFKFSFFSPCPVPLYIHGHGYLVWNRPDSSGWPWTYGDPPCLALPVLRWKKWITTPKKRADICCRLKYKNHILSNKYNQYFLAIYMKYFHILLLSCEYESWENLFVFYGSGGRSLPPQIILPILIF